MARYVVVLALILGALALVGAGCGGGDDESSPPPATETSGGGETTTGGGETTTGGGTTGDATNGEAVFASAGCGGCHTFSKAGSSGSIGPNLDDAAPSFDKVVTQVTNGGGPMPSFKDQLSEQEIRDVAAFVSGSSS
ncbi:MAG TPA: c-type cytochrome [Gaiella sp.]|jgi:mono/diheme cytochrome c family protein|nr:c-type cytochrome [Gaiella sp.]